VIAPSSGLACNEGRVLGDNMAAGCSRFGGERDLVQRAGWLPRHHPGRAREAVCDLWAWSHGGRAEARSCDYLPDATSGVRRLWVKSRTGCGRRAG
jgi:hypothetical protein